MTTILENGLEFTKRSAITEGLEADIYMANPYASLKYCFNENTNGLVERYFIKGTELYYEIKYLISCTTSRPRSML
jgi:IS30 family transposase